MSDNPDLNSAYSLKTPEDSKRLYAKWARSYDRDFVDETGYVLFLRVAEAFAEAGGTGPVLDIGAGTGRVGVELRRLGYVSIDGTDISQQMLDEAAEKGVYSKLFVGNILKRIDAPDGHYAGIVSAGTFTLGHVGPDGLDEIVRLLAPEGIAVISVRDTHFEKEGFGDKLVQLKTDLDCVSQVLTPVYGTRNGNEHDDDQALLLTLRRR